MAPNSNRNGMAVAGHKRQRQGGDDDATSGEGATMISGADYTIHELGACNQAVWKYVP
jgi:hypothetical protein